MHGQSTTKYEYRCTNDICGTLILLDEEVHKHIQAGKLGGLQQQYPRCNDCGEPTVDSKGKCNLRFTGQEEQFSDDRR